MISTKRKRIYQSLLILVSIPLLLFTAWSGWQLYSDSNERADAKDYFSEANSIEYGLFSVNIWKDEIKEILKTQIDSFELTPEQEAALRKQVEGVLNSLIDEAKNQVQTQDESFKQKIRKIAVNAFVDWDNVRQMVPAFAETIVTEATSDENKEQLKTLATQKLNNFADQTFDDSDSVHLYEIYSTYGQDNRADFNKEIDRMSVELENRGYLFTFIILGILIFFLLPWFLVYKKRPELHKPLFIVSVILALIVLLTGLTTPMIEIDARIATLDFTLLGQHIEFHDQMLFYRSKSILQVVWILLETKKFDSVFVGVLILAFSVLLPMSKLLATEVFLIGKSKLRHNKIVQWLVFKSAKWSMADVMVVAIFMSFVGFSGILDSQLEILNMDSQSVSSIATNLTSLQPGFIIFLAFVLYSLILSTILKKITPKRELE